MPAAWFKISCLAQINIKNLDLFNLSSLLILQTKNIKAEKQKHKKITSATLSVFWDVDTKHISELLV